MSRTILNFWLDTLLLILFLLLIWVSTVLHFVFPPGPKANNWTLWGGDYLWWRDAQFIVLCIMALAVLLHVMLHWSWVCGVAAGKFMKRRDGKKRHLDDGQRTLAGVGMLIVLLNVMGLALAAAALMIDGPAS